ncbi:MAG TPA: AI-2E family transporter [Verrucomicrobiae bacterium]|nr:AI-2E family transporter [Verrucomicrobiae bacterium]
MEPRVISISTETIVKTVGIVIAIALAWFIRDILLLLFSAALIAGIVYPFATWAQSRKFPKALAVALLYLGVLAVLGTAIGFLIPAVVEQARAAAGHFGDTLAWLRDGASYIRDTTDRLGLDVSTAPTVDSFVTRLQEVAFHFLSSVNDLFGAVAAGVIVLVLSFYIVIEDEAVKRGFHALIPERHREFATNTAWAIVLKLGDWARGQIVVSLVTSVSYFVGLTVLGVPYPLLLALLAGLLEFVPYLGAFVAASLAVLLALTVAPWKALALILYLLVIHQMQMNFVQPLVMRRAVGLNPVISIAAFLIGAKLFGPVGAIFAIPVATAISVSWLEFERYQQAHPPAA